LSRKILECEPEGHEGREYPWKERMDVLRRSVTELKLAVDATRGRDRWRNLVLGGGKPWYSGRSLDGWMDE
jgi:hypothetical protein